MPANAATIGYLATLYYQSGSSWVELGNYAMVKQPQVSVTSIETTPLDATGATKTFIPGLIDGGSVTASVFWTSAAYTSLYGMLRDEMEWKITSPSDGSADQDFLFSGFLTSIDGPTFEVEGVLKVDIEIKVSDLPTLA